MKLSLVKSLIWQPSPHVPGHLLGLLHNISLHCPDFAVNMISCFMTSADLGVQHDVVCDLIRSSNIKDVATPSLEERSEEHDRAYA